MEPDRISIAQFRSRNLPAVTTWRDDLLISNRVDDVHSFRHPCRMDAVTVLVCIGGTLECSINLRRYSVGANTLLVNLTGDVIQIHRAERLEAYVVLLSSDFLKGLQIDFRQRAAFLLDIRREAATPLPFEEIRLLRPYYELLKNNMESPRMEAAEVVRGLVRAFSYTILSLLRAYRPQEAAAVAVPRNRQLFDKFMALLTLHHTRERSVTFYAGRLCLTPNYLSGAIKECTGKTALEWINEYVVLEAKILLRNEDITVSEVAYRLNFPTQSAFGKYFKQQVGVGPKEYRVRG